MHFPSVLLAPVAAAMLLLAGCGDPTATDRQKAAQKAMEKGDHAAALIELKSGLQLEPKSGELRLMLASLLLDIGEPGSAAVELRKVIELGQSTDAVTAKLASALVASGKFKDVTDAYATVSLSDSAARAELGGAVAAAWLGQRSLAQALQVANETLKVAPDYGPALLVSARLSAMGGNIDEALALTDKAAAKGPAVGEALMLRALLLGGGKKDRDGAIAAFERAARHSTVAMGARSGLFQLHLGGRDLPKAKAELAVLKKSHPKHPNTVYLSAVLAYTEGKLEQVEGLTDALLKLTPDNAQVLTLAGAGHLRRGALVAAESKLGRVVQTVDKAPLARKLLADVYLRMGQADKALSTLAPLVSEGSDADVLAMSAQAHLQKGQLVDAEAAFSSALKIKPDDVRLRTSMALTDLAKGRPDAAYDALQKLAERDAGQTADLAIISAHLQRYEFDRALVAIARLEQKQPKAALPLHLRGMALIGKADATGARQAFEAALRVEPTYFASTEILAKLDSKAGNHSAARNRIESAIELAPRNLASRMALIDVLRASGSPPEKVLEAIDEAARIHPTEAEPHLAKLAHLEKYRGAKEAAGHAQVAMAALSSHPQVLDAAGRAFAAAAEDQQAIAAFNRLTAALPQSPLPYLRLADLYTRRGNRAEAAVLLNRAFETAPDSPEVQRRLLEHAERSQDFKAVLAAARELQRRQPSSSAGYMLEGAAESSRKSWPAAKLAYKAALSKSDGRVAAPRAYYSTLKRAGEGTLADRFAVEWLKANPRDVNLRGLLGSDAILDGRLVEAEQHFRQIVDIEPHSAAALNNLAWLLAERKDPAAIQMAERALALAPHSVAVMDTMAKALDVDGKVQSAIGFQRRAADAPGGMPGHRLKLARLLAKAGDRDAAIKELDKLAAQGGGNQSQAAIQELRAQLLK